MRWWAAAALAVLGAFMLPITAQTQSVIWHDDSFTDSTGRTLLYRVYVRSDWDLSLRRGIALILHGGNTGTAEALRQVRWPGIEEALDLGLAAVVPASPYSGPEGLTFGEQTLVGLSVGRGGQRSWAPEDGRLIHELLQRGLDARLAVDYDKIIFAGGSQGTCFLAEFLEFYGGTYGGGFHAHCGCFWLDLDGDDSFDGYAVFPPFLQSPWRPTFQWTPRAADATSHRFSVFVEATTGDFLHPDAVSMSQYYSEWLGLRTATDLDAPGGHCASGATPRSAIYDWLLSGTGPELPRRRGDTDRDGTPNRTDVDDDNDGAPDFIDALRRDRRDWRDTDADGIVDALDWDADGDGVRNGRDAFPLDSREQRDTDRDGIGNRLDGDDDNDGIPDRRDPRPRVGTENGRNLAFVINRRGISGYRRILPQRVTKVHAGEQATVVYPERAGQVQSYHFLELGEQGRFEIMVDRFLRPESCSTVLLNRLCNVGRFSSGGFVTTYYQDRFDRIWIDRNRNRNLTDDGPPLLMALTGEWTAQTAPTVLKVPYAAGQVLPYAIVFRGRENLPEGLYYTPASVWRGKVVAPTGERVSVIVVDGNVDGYFNSHGDFVCLDFDRDGWLNECDFSKGERRDALTPPCEWDGGKQGLSVSPSGHSVTWFRESRDEGTEGAIPSADTQVSVDRGSGRLR